MFTIRRTLTLGVGQVKWGAPSETGSLTTQEAAPPVPPSALMTPEQIKVEGNKLKTQLQSPDTPEANKAKIQATMDKYAGEYRNITHNTIDSTTELKKDPQTPKAVVMSKTVDGERIDGARHLDLGDIIDSSTKYDDAKKFQLRISALANLDRGKFWGVERENKGALFASGQEYIVGEMQVQNILSDYYESQASLDDMLKSHGVTPDWTTAEGIDKTCIEFRDKIVARANIVAQLTRMIAGDANVSAGLVAVFQKKDEAYLANLLKNPASLSEVVEKNQGSMSRFMDKATSMLMSIGLGVLIPPLHVAYEKRVLSVQDGKVTGKDPLSVNVIESQSGKTNVTAKIRGLEAVAQLNLNDVERSMVKDTESFAKTIQFDKDGKVSPTIQGLTSDDQQLIKYYNENLTKLPASQKMLVDILANNHLVSLAEKNQGAHFKGIEGGISVVTLGVFVGLTGQYIDKTVLDKKYDITNANVQESNTVLGKKVSLADIGVTKTKNADNTYTYTVKPDGYEVTEQMFADVGFAKNPDGTYTLTTTKQLSARQDVTYLIGGQKNYRTTLTFTEPVPSRPDTTTADTVRALESLADNNFGSAMYELSRHPKKYPQLQDIITSIHKGNDAGAKKAIDALAALDPKDKKNAALTALIPLAKVMKNNVHNGVSLDTFLLSTYGATGKLDKGNANKAQYLKAHPLSVRKAEDQLMGASENTTKFDQQKVFTPKNLSERIPGQNMALSVAATPLNKDDRTKSIHRVDTYQGSIQTSEYYPITRTDLQDRLIREHAKTIDAEFTKAKRLDPALTREQYVDILKTGKLPYKSTLKFDGNKTPQFIETRAMVQGNRCLNRTEAIIFPQFRGQPAAQVENNDVVVGVSGQIGEEAARVRELSIGIGNEPKDNEKTEEDKGQTTNPKPGENPNGDGKTPTGGSDGTGYINNTPATSTTGSGGNNVTQGVPQAPTPTPTPIPTYDGKGVAG